MMRGKFKKLLSAKKVTEISGSFDGDDTRDSLLATSAHNADDWDAWSLGKRNGEEEDDRGRSGARSMGRRSQSERPSTRQRSKSEVRKRLKRMAEDLSASTKRISGSKSAGVVGKGSSADVHSRVESLALERAVSDSNVGPSGLMDAKPKKLRGGRRKSARELLPEDSDLKETKKERKRSKSSSRRGSRAILLDDTEKKESKKERKRSKSASARGRRTSVVDASEPARARSTSKLKRSSSKKRSTSKKPKSKTWDIQTGTGTDDSSTITSKSKKKKKKEKSKRANRSIDETSSIPSNVDMDHPEMGSQASNLSDSIKSSKKKEKNKEKKKKKAAKTLKTGNFPELPPDDFGDGLEGLAEQFRRSKESYGNKDGADSEAPGADAAPENSSYSKVNSMFENAWMGSPDEKKSENPFDCTADESHNPFDSSPSESQNPFADEPDPFEENALRTAMEYEAKQVELNKEQQEELLSLQQQLSAALQKQVTMSEEHLAEKNELMQVSRELERVKVELAEANEERGELLDEVKDRDRIIEEDRNRISNLEEAIDAQLEKEEELIKTVQQSEEEIEKLLEEIQTFEKKLENGDTEGGGASFVELRNVKKALEDRESEVAAQKLKIERLEEDLKDSMTVPQMQIDELDQENKALQGRLKGERLEYTSKLATKDDQIQKLQTELTAFRSSPDAQDLQSARQKLIEAREDASQVREDLAATRKLVEELHGEREDMVEKYNLLKDKSGFVEKTVKELTLKSDNLAKKVLEWTEKTYDWKKKYETADRKLKELSEENKGKLGSTSGSMDSEDTDMADENPQAMILQGIMDNQNSTRSDRRGSRFSSLFNSGKQEMSEEDIRIRVLEEQNHEYEAKIAQLNSDIVKMQSGHKEELYTIKKKIAQLEGENDALVLQNATLEKLRES